MALTKVSGDVIQSTINIGVATATSVNVGSAVTINSSGITAVGVVTATSFTGNLTGNVTGNATGLSGTPNITVGVVTATTFSGNLTGNVNSSGVSTVTTLRATSIVGVTTAGITTAYIGSVNDGPISGARNRIINGSMDIWQRGTSFSNMSATTTYTADRWSCYRDSYATNCSVSQITGISQNGINRNALRMQRTLNDTNTSVLNVTQSLESINSRDLAGQSVTLSFWVRCGSNFSSSGRILTAAIGTGTATDQAARGGITGFSVQNLSCSLTESFQRFSFTRILPNDANQIIIYFSYTPTGTAAANDFFDIMDVQLEPGTVATPFERRSFGQELALCQRYYFAQQGLFMDTVGSSYNTLSTIRYAHHIHGAPFPVPMRSNPIATYTMLMNGVTNVSSSYEVTVNNQNCIRWRNGNSGYATQGDLFLTYTLSAEL
jgi:hypothetical protein